LRYANDPVIRINLLLLMAVSFLPYPTRLVAEAIRDESAERAAAIFYGVCLLAIALAIVAPQAAAFGYLLIAVVAVLRARGDEGTAEPA
jgi:uncharacterized membrane protein